MQGIEYGETISLLMVSGHSLHDWPEGPFPADAMKSLFRDRDGTPVLALQVVVVHILGLMLLSCLSDKTIQQPRYLAIIWPFAVVVLAKSAWWFTTRSSGVGPGWPLNGRRGGGMAYPFSVILDG